jgi:hypothetical protein
MYTATYTAPYTETYITRICGAIAQLGERIVRNDEVVGSIPTSSTKESTLYKPSETQSRSISFQFNVN